MHKPLLLVCVIALPLLTSGCQSYSMHPVQVSTAEQDRPPAPEAWFMESFEPTLTQELLKELSPSPIEATARSSP
jgi:hypothetical protein